MEPTKPIPPDPTALTTRPADHPATGITDRPDEAAPPLLQPPAAPTPGGTTALIVTGVLCLSLLTCCLLYATGVLDSLVLIGIPVVVVAVLHYFFWGRSLSRQVAEEQRQELLRLAEQDERYLPDPRRPRHL